MEHLSIHDRPPSGQATPGPSFPPGQMPPQQRGQQMMPPPPPSVPQLPPQMFTTAAQLLDLTDMLQDTIERIFAGQQYADVSRGLFLIRGENVMLLGEIVSFSHTSNKFRDQQRSQDLDKDDYIPPQYTKGDVDEVYSAYKEETEAKKLKDKSKQRAMKGLGFVEGETGADILS
ncbi:hypothetical protein ANO11243_025850 [Dothideomycetidae sp. 11243]|nr:hypothetical protein ANO11243_025850 [fungal sp. No.11243]